jgi:hypothetical protein
LPNYFQNNLFLKNIQNLSGLSAKGKMFMQQSQQMAKVELRAYLKTSFEAERGADRL